MARRGHPAENNARSGRSRALRACAAKPRSFPPPRGEMRAKQKRPCLPECTTGTVPETLRQRHCARGAAAGGMLSACPLIRGRGAADFGRRPTGGGAGVKGAWPPAASFPHFLSVQEMGPPAGAGPGNYAARRAVCLRGRCRSTTDKLRRSMSGQSKTAVGRPPTTSAARRAANPYKSIAKSRAASSHSLFAASPMSPRPDATRMPRSSQPR